MIVLTLPYPVSGNRYWRSFVPRGGKRAITVVSDEAKAYKRAVEQAAVLAAIGQPIKGRVRVEIRLYPKRPQDWVKRARLDPHCWDDTVLSLDLDNANKVLLDALKGIAIEDDRWVRELHSHRMEPDGEARVVVTITALHVEPSPQTDLLEQMA